MASSSSAWQWKHTVFLSFSGEDVRDNFISFLYKELCKISSDVYIDYRLKPAEEIAPALMEAIERSKIAVIVFSKSYASSTWCLDELERIIEWNKSHGQMVIPVFYNVDSSHVHDPTSGIYAEVFARHEWNLKGSLALRLRTAILKALCLPFGLLMHQEEVDQVGRWKNAMIKAANFKGWDSKVIRPDTALVDVVVKDVLEKLIEISPVSSDGFLGIDSRIERIKGLLSLEENDVCVLGIWGMGGIGKTTTAKALFKQVVFKFDVSCFLDNISQESGKPGGLSRLRKKFLSNILGITVPNMEYSSVLQQMLSLKKALIVLDGLTDLEQLSSLTGEDTRWFGWLGSGSRIIITSRDREIVGKKGILGDNVRVIDPYEVRRLSYADSFKLFSHNAFERKQVTDNFWILSDSFVKYAGGIPLALKVLGRHLLGRDKESWERSLMNLNNGPLKGIQSVLRLSYDELSNDGKKMFLDIACFLNGEDIGVVRRLFQLCDSSEDISCLIDKCLLSESSYGEAIMHNLVLEMGKEIEREKPLLDCSRLWNYKDISKVFNSKKEWERIESISLDISKTKQVLHLDSKAFERTPNLKLLKFYSSDDKFGDFKDYNKFKVVLPQQGLDSFPDDLVYLYWHGFPSKSLPAKFSPSNLVVLRMPHSNIEKLLEEDEGVKASKEFELHYSCDIVPSSSQTANLSNTNRNYYTNLKKAPSTMTCLGHLCLLDLSFSMSVESLPSAADLKFLEVINLKGCSNLVNFPNVSKSTKFLNLFRTGIKEVSLSILNLNLSWLSLGGCPNLTSVPFNILFSKSLQSCSLAGSSNVNTLEFLETIDSLPDEEVSTVTYLSLSSTDVHSLPTSIMKLSNLRTLVLSSCKNLQYVPELPGTLISLQTDDCTSLETIFNLQKVFNADFDLISEQEFIFTNCLKVDKTTWHDCSLGIIRRIKRMATKANCYYHSDIRPCFWAYYPGSEIPKGFASSTYEGTFVTLELLPRWNSSQFLGFALCAITQPNDELLINGIHCRFRFQNMNGDSYTTMCCSNIWRHMARTSELILTDHVLIWYDYIVCEEVEKRRDWFREDCNDKVTFEFFFLDEDLKEERVVKNCGVLPLYADDDDDDGSGGLEASYNRSPHMYCDVHQMEYIIEYYDY